VKHKGVQKLRLEQFGRPAVSTTSAQSTTGYFKLWMKWKFKKKNLKKKIRRFSSPSLSDFFLNLLTSEQGK